jgi:hypothetical protein
MRFCTAACVLLLCAFTYSQDNPTRPSEPNSVTIPMTIDHNRVVINVEVPLPDGSTQRVRAWVDNGDPDLNLSRRLAMQLQLAVSCNDKDNDHDCSSPPPPEIIVGGMKIPLIGVKQAKIPLNPVDAASVRA